MQGSGLAPVYLSQIPEACSTALGFGVIGGWELEMGKAICGQWEGWILFIDHNLSRNYVLLLMIPVSVRRRMDGSCNDVTNPMATAPRYLYSETPRFSIYSFRQYQNPPRFYKSVTSSGTPRESDYHQKKQSEMSHEIPNITLICEQPYNNTFR